MIYKKRGVSTVVATVLIIVISFAAIAIVIGIIIPMVKESLGQGKSCFDLRDYFKILDSEYTCYNSTSTSLMVERSVENMEVKGFAVSIISGGNADVYKIYNGVNDGRIKMLNDTGIYIPAPGQARTYIFNVGKGEGARISVLQTNDKSCEPAYYEIPDCSSV